MKKINKKGFTLVELLLVIAIIGILAAVLFVSLGKQRERARMTTFKENMRGLVTAATACHDAGGEILAAQGSNLCDADGAGADGGIGEIPEIRECDGSADFLATFDIANPIADDWTLTATCIKTDDTVPCTASCTMDGCIFADPGCE